MSPQRCAWALAAIASLGLVGCKRQRAPKVAEVWDIASTDLASASPGSMTPAWPPPTRAVLDSGLATFWLHEPSGPVFHARLLLPTSTGLGLAQGGGLESGVSVAAASVVAEHMRQSLTRRLAALGAVVELAYAPDRIELAIHASNAHAGRILSGIASALQPHVPAAALARAQDRVAEQLGAAVTEHAAVATLVAGLLGRAPASQRVAKAELAALGPEILAEAWRLLADPRRAVLVVHAGTSAEQMRGALRSLSDRWHGLGRRAVAPNAVARLRAPVAPKAGPARLLAAPATPIGVTVGPTTGSPVLVVGRVIPTDSAAARSLARLAQRIVGEELDARLVVAGDQAVFVLRVSLSRRDPDGSATEAIDRLSELARTRQPQQRLFAAAQLWLGGRIVQASLHGEDWTALWSEAMDLAGSDDDIATALATDAQAMLQADADTLLQWQERWLDPRAGEGGWAWTVAGADEAMLRRLSRIAPIAGSSLTSS